ncbi:hypothetical protein [Streptomyces sp. NPDC056524]|uniref:hypothetical protein n=1 Tax=Streptomyces sp. NPDC056524 TaxID=3345851 RepID=UPI003673F349
MNSPLLLRRMTGNTPSVQLHLGPFENFAMVTGLLRDTGARRTHERVFVLEESMTAEQVLALVHLLEFDRRWCSPAITVVPTPRLLTSPYSTTRNELRS